MGLSIHQGLMNTSFSKRYFQTKDVINSQKTLAQVIEPQLIVL